MSKKQKFDYRRLCIAISPILIFILLIPFMHSKVPYHTDLLGNVDGTGSKLALFGIAALFSLVIYYVYGKRDEKNIVYLLVITILALLDILFLTGAIFESKNLFTGFYRYLNTSYGNQVTFLLFCFSLFMFLFVEKIPLNSFIGIKNSVTNKSDMAWKMVHNRSRMQFWYGAMLNLLIFYIPSLSAFAKLIISFLVMMFCWIYIVYISKVVSKELN